MPGETCVSGCDGPFYKKLAGVSDDDVLPTRDLDLRNEYTAAGDGTAGYEVHGLRPGTAYDFYIAARVFIPGRGYMFSLFVDGYAQETPTFQQFIAPTVLGRGAVRVSQLWADAMEVQITAPYVPEDVTIVGYQVYYGDPADAAPVADDDLVAGRTYTITTAGDTTWGAVGAPAEDVGTLFTATGPAALASAGTGTATLAKPCEDDPLLKVHYASDGLSCPLLAAAFPCDFDVTPRQYMQSPLALPTTTVLAQHCCAACAAFELFPDLGTVSSLDLAEPCGHCGAEIVGTSTALYVRGAAPTRTPR